MFGANGRLQRIAGLIDWTPIEHLLAPLRAPTGRPGYPPLAAFRALRLAQWYQLSDPTLEEALSDQLCSRAEAKVVIETWRGHCNTVRPNSSLGDLTPAPFVAKLVQQTAPPAREP